MCIPDMNVGRAPHLSNSKHIIYKPKGVHTEYDNEVLIDGRWYDISEFAKRHPGGNIIRFYKGKNATEAFNEFHERSTKAKLMLKSMRSREDGGRSKLAGDLDPLTRDFTALRNELKAEGLFKTSLSHIVYRYVEIALMFAIGIYMMLHGLPISGIAVTAIASGRCGWLMHEAGHGSLTGVIALDIPLQVLTYGLGCGMSAAWWRSQHNKHHATPQKLGSDVDLATLPLVMFNSEVQHTKAGAAMFSRHWIRLQAYLFAPVTCLLVGLGWQLYLHPRHCIRKKQFAELATFGIRWAAIYTLASAMGAGALMAVGGYLLHLQIGCCYIFLNFALSHTHLPVLKEDEDVSWVRYAGEHTMNVDPGPLHFVSWWMSFLNYQIEHHLLPSVPQFNHPKIAPRVKALFEKHGLPYRSMPYVDAMRATFANLDKIGADAFVG